MSVVKIGLIGFGTFGKKIYHCLQNIQEIKVVFVVKQNLDQESRDISEKEGFELIDLEQSLRHMNLVDWVIIATPTNNHFTVVKTALEMNTNVFCEKPLCTKIEESEELIDLAEKKDLKLMVDEVFLYREAYQFIKKQTYWKQIKNVSFLWQKHGSFKDNILNNLVYHDLYLIQDLLGAGSLVVEEVTKKSPDGLEFTAKYNQIDLNFNYNRLFEGSPQKVVKVELSSGQNIIWQNNVVEMNGRKVLTESKNALQDMLFATIVENRAVGYTQRRALNTLAFIEEIGAILS